MINDLDNISLNFILSTGRTGSTLLSSMLNMHPEILSAVEEPFAYNLYSKYKDITDWTNYIIEQFCYDFYLFSEGKLEPQFGKKEDLFNILHEHRSQLTGERAIKLAYFAFFPGKDKSKIKIIIDKQLKFHYFLEEVAEMYPQSKFVILCRDPRDNVLIKMKRAQKKQKRQSVLFFAKTWNFEYKTINSKINNITSNRFIKIKYEDLVKQPEETLKIITNFFNIPYNDIMLKYDENFKGELDKHRLNIGDTVKQHLSLFHEGLTQKVNTDKVGIWKKQLSEYENNLIWSVSKETAIDYSYMAEGCQKISYFQLNMLYDLLRFYFNKIIVPSIYYSIPFNLKYVIKKIKYGKNFKNGRWATKDFYKTTLPKTK